MKSPPVLHIMAAPSTNRSGDKPPMRDDESALLCPVKIQDFSVRDFLLCCLRLLSLALILLIQVFPELRVPERDDD